MTRASRKADDRTARQGRLRLLSSFLWCLAVALLLAGQRVYAAADIEIIVSAHTPYYDELADNLKASVSAQDPTVSLQVTSDRNLVASAINKDSLLVAIGTSATEFALQEFPHNPLLSLFVTESAWRNMTGGHENDVGKRAAIFINQPLDRAIVLATLLKPEMKTLSTVFGPVSRQQAPLLHKLAAESGLKLIAEEIDEQANPLAKLTPLINNSDLFLAIPDQGIFNRAIARWALYLSYKRKIPVIGFSRSYTQAGALASLLSSPQDISRQAGEWLNHYINREREGLWQAFEPQYFTLEINPSVARALDIQITSEEAIYQQLVQRLDKDQTP